MIFNKNPKEIPFLLVSSKGLIQIKMAKSTVDAGWSLLKTMLEYKSANAGVVFEKVNEADTTPTCSCCGEENGFVQIVVRSMIATSMRLEIFLRSDMIV